MSSVSIVTGATRGLGFATAQALAHLGHLVVVSGRDEGAAQDAAEKLRAGGGRAQFVQLDVTSETSVKSAAAQVARWTDHVDVLVNNAGVLPEWTDNQPHEFASVTMFERTFQTNVFGAVAVTEQFLPLLHRSRAGRIVNISSTMGSLHDQTNPDSPYFQMVVPAYQSSKAALNAVTITLSKALAASNIKVTSVCPGFVQTNLTPISREQAPLTAEQAVAPIISAATLPAGAPSGQFVDAAGIVAW
ncbi:SDR family NAD(P)-dependent oxidoreductase [Pseudonocardia parietis]|uniref:NAD(P)-dependent dehydrogenase (Short-subunit alcohol dehydrogenase family) n=1 Tax=Pseudonocardia parietis TaxID=570936 RepID=A0ABS4VX61_9PSEU|nr:SDR family NAD(P)-dependent oxidoreductase [Pseudonocardia parietis]MBP2368318.1 NAD(P)-dependent dehydrogenase (short-subunit alcohol dehydrogenase family) [Pseudonocardia parietis]